jgi:rRNA maturation RNase YbeY
MSEIYFFYENIEEVFFHPENIKEWIESVIQTEKSSLVALNFIFCDDEFLLKMNQDYLQHDTYTDIITFDQSENGLEIEGDIFISAERVRENAQTLQEDFSRELKRVIVHGVLHLLGYGDKSVSEKAEMREKENFYIEQSPVQL